MSQSFPLLSYAMLSALGASWREGNIMAEPQRFLLGPVSQRHLQPTQTFLFLRWHLHLPLAKVSIELSELEHCHGEPTFQPLSAKPRACLLDSQQAA